MIPAPSVTVTQTTCALFFERVATITAEHNTVTIREIHGHAPICTLPGTCPIGPPPTTYDDAVIFWLDALAGIAA